MDLNKIFIDIFNNEQEFRHIMNLNKNSKLYQELSKLNAPLPSIDITYNLIFLKFHAFLVSAAHSKAFNCSEHQQFIVFLDMEEKDFFFYSIKNELIIVKNISFILNREKVVSINLELFVELLKQEPKKIKDYLFKLSI